VIELHTDDYVRIRGRCVQVWRVTPRWLHRLGEWSSPATRRLYPDAVALNYGQAFLLDGKACRIEKSAVSRCPRIVVDKPSAAVPSDG
jgi:hypothetical protein